MLAKDYNNSMKKFEQLRHAMIAFEKGNPKHIQHFLKVYEFAHIICSEDQVDPLTTQIVESAALVHDIGINTCLEKYQSSAGHLQEKEGPSLAIQMMEEIGYDSEFIYRIAYLVGHHHSYDEIDGLDYQILIEADFLVNMYEEAYSQEQIESVYQKIFRTKTGKYLCETMYL